MESGISIVKRNFLFKFVMFILILMGLSCSRASALKVEDEVKDYLTFTAIDGDATVKFNWSEANKVMCSVDNGKNWFNYDANKEIYLEKDKSVKFKGSGVITGRFSEKGFETSGGNLSVSGNLNSLRLDENLEKFVGLQDGCFWGIFRYRSKLLDASQLILDAEILSPDCYGYMFNGCENLIKAPDLPATNLAPRCYDHMFWRCKSLTEAPDLLATTLAHNCYAWMFDECESLTKAPDLPATTLEGYCYHGMFYGCTNLTEAPNLPATALKVYCYNSMFNGCEKLTKAPDLLITYCEEGCCSSMFSGCTSLTKAPKLPATSLALTCYSGMFSGCISLTQAPELSATSLATKCYSNMFKGCTSLTNIPELPATQLADFCYDGMFSECTNLEFSELMTDKYNKEWTIKTDDGKSGYKTMFNGCIVNWLKYAPENSTVTLYQKEKDNLMGSNGLTGSYNNDNKSELLSTTSEKQEASSPQEPSDDIDPKYDSDTKSVSSNQLANSQDYESKSSKSLAASKNSDSASSSSLTSNQSSYSGSSNAAKSSAIKTGELTANSALLEFFLLMFLSFKRKRFGC